VRRLGVEPDGEFPPFVDLAAFLAGEPTPLPDRPRALFIGVLERYKGFDTLADAWPQVHAALPAAELHVVGRGTLAASAQGLAQVGAVWTESLDATGVAAAMDGATLLCLPSRAEGLGRVVIEAMLRGRGVIGGDAGGIPDLVENEVTGLLVVPGESSALASALIRLLGDRELAARTGARARRKGVEIAVSPEEYAARLAAVVQVAIAG
jgi:glycosyltransferase involved in cell wall biosynthesis